MDRTKVTLIRPLILLSEKDTRRFVKKYNKSVMPKVCPMDEHTKREDMKEQIYTWQKEIPTIDNIKHLILVSQFYFLLL